MAFWRGVSMLASLWLVACAGSSLHEAPVETRGSAVPAASFPSPVPSPLPVPPPLPARTGTPADPVFAPMPAAIERPASRWVSASWDELPGLHDDALEHAVPAWTRSCERPAGVWRRPCEQLRALARQAVPDRGALLGWMRAHLQPYRVLARDESARLQGTAGSGLLTAYYEPEMSAMRERRASHAVPLYRAPADLAQRKPWYTREQIDTLPAAQAALRGREIAWMADPLDALVLQIQGSGRLRITEADGSQRLVRLSFAGSNEHPYRSVGAWLLQQGLVRDASWPGIKEWAQRNPHRVQELLWTNPRYVFFREEPLADGAAAAGPRGAQGVPLTAGRSIAVDPQSIPYGTPVWLASDGPTLPLRRLVLAQDTGAAITGAVRADYFIGSGAAAGEVAGRLKQPLALWVLWPRTAPPP